MKNLLAFLLLIFSTGVFSQTNVNILTTSQQSDAASATLSYDGTAVELGLKFRATSAGNITGLRFYRSVNMTGTNTGHLWSSGGSLLGTVTFTNGASPGWKEATLGAPVAITANTTYVVSVHSSSGDYVASNSYLVSSTNNGPLKALSDGEDGSNGIYDYGTNGTFPTSTYGSTNYWVDVVFTVTGGGNISPVVNAGANQTITLPLNTVTLTGTTTDADGTIASRLWTKLSGGSATITTPTTASTTITGLQEGSYTFRLSATDNSGATTTDDIIITVYPAAGGGPTSNFNFTAIPFSDPDIVSPARGAEHWNRISPGPFSIGNNQITVPAGNTEVPDAYARIEWYELEPGAQGVYNWTKLEDFIRNCITKRKKASFGIMHQLSGAGNHSPSGAACSYPAYVHTAMQAEGSAANRDAIISGAWVPNYNNETYLTAIENLNNATAAFIASGSYAGVNYRDVINYVDIRGVGEFGEWHHYPYIDQIYGTNRYPTITTLKRIIDSHLDAFANYPLVAMIAGFDNNTGASAITPAEVTAYLLTSTNNWGKVGWRWDSWGQGIYSNILENNPGSWGGTNFATEIMNRYRYAPVGGEPSSWAEGVSDNLTQSLYYLLPSQINTYKASFFGNGNYDVGQILADPNAQANIRNASKNAGYRIILTGGSCTSSPAIGGNFNITLNYQNTGIAPVYANWYNTYELRNAGGTVVWKDTSSFKLREFLPSASANTVSETFVLPGTVATGTYNLFLVIRDSTRYRDPFPLAITGRGADGSYLLRSNVTVTSIGNQAPVVNAGLSRTITLPVNTVTLNGSASDADGTIASYSWTKVSGGVVYDTVDLVLIYGDSNAGGQGANTDATGVELAPRPNIKILNNTTFAFQDLDIGTNNHIDQNQDGTGLHGIELALANEIDKTSFTLNRPVYIVKAGVSGADTKEYIPYGGAGYWTTLKRRMDSAVSKLNQAGLKYRLTVMSTMLLNDLYNCGTCTEADSKANLDSTKRELRRLYDVNAVIIHQNLFDLFDWNNVFDELAAADPTRVFVTDITGATYIDGNSHYDYAGFKVIAERNMSTMLAQRIAQGGVLGTSASLTLTNLVAGNYTFRLTATDDDGASSSSDVGVTVNPATTTNSNPVANAGVDSTITLPKNTVALIGSGTDNDGTIVSYNWQFISGPTGASILSPSSASTQIGSLIAGSYVFRLTVTDNLGATATDNVSVIVNPVIANIVPVVNAGINQVITAPVDSVILTAVASDADGSIATYTWSKILGPSGSGISTPGATSTKVTGLVVGTHVFRVSVSDNVGATASDEVIVTVNSLITNTVPVANAGSDQSILSPASVVTLSGSGTDGDGTITSYAWSKISGPSGAGIASPLNASTNVTGLIIGNYVFRLSVTDNAGAVATDDVSVVVLSPITVLPNAGKDKISYGSSVTVNGYIPPGGSATSWSKVSGPAGGTIVSPSSANTSITGLELGVYIFRLSTTVSSVVVTDDIKITVNSKKGRKIISVTGY